MSISLNSAAKLWFFDGRGYITPEDFKQIFENKKDEENSLVMYQRIWSWILTNKIEPEDMDSLGIDILEFYRKMRSFVEPIFRKNIKEWKWGQ